MEIRVLRYFVTMAREGNMTRAAERLFVTQPTLSKQLKDLEEELGRKLYERTNYSIRLTDAGMLLRSGPRISWRSSIRLRRSSGP